MSYKTIVAYIDEAKRCETLLNVARSLAEAQNATLIGLHVVPNVQIFAAGEPQVMADLFESEQRRFAEVASEASAFFNTGMKDASCKFEWHEVEEGSETVGERVLEHGLVADLVITGQIDPDIESPRRVGTPERIIMHGGRPQLMVPYIKLEGDLIRHVMIAWRASGEAARAVFDAMPLLKSAKKVTILEVDAEASAEVARVAGGEALAANLQRHGVVKPEVEH
ncbi:MAG: universal stress protein, partial [Rhizobiales bacterium]|nr:universal stress protein [Hyphomicrobiales bacterium]